MVILRLKSIIGSHSLIRILLIDGAMHIILNEICANMATRRDALWQEWSNTSTYCNPSSDRLDAVRFAVHHSDNDCTDTGSTKIIELRRENILHSVVLSSR